MPREDDNSERPNTLPPPELDPTLNPLLGQNMGRWAEVYFTSAPDKREEAVLELLRTLEAENGAQEAGTQGEAVAPPPLVVEHAPAPRPSPKSQIAEDSSRLIPCHACGRENRAHQRFCGMCGARLEKAAATDPQIEEPTQIASAPSAPSWEQLRPLEPPVEEPARMSGEFSRAREGGERESSDDFLNRFSDASQGSNSSLYYVGTTLAIVILAISYIAWRGAHTTSGSSLAPQPPPVVSGPSVSTAPIPIAPNITSSSLSPTAAAGPANTNAGSSLEAKAAEPTPEATAFATDEKNPETPAFSGNGSEELATARRYLDGADGQQQNPAEAVNWLWKAVAKRNTEATLLLSDLFLKGNGVPKNCDQGRVLLDAAASRGSKDAAERLRHLQAFGCQ